MPGTAASVTPRLLLRGHGRHFELLLAGVAVAAAIAGCGSAVMRPAPGPRAAPTREPAVQVGTNPAVGSGAAVHALTVQTLMPLLSFTPYLYSALPPGHTVQRVIPAPNSIITAHPGAIQPGQVAGFTILIGGPAGQYSIEVNEGVLSPSPAAPNYENNPRNPLIAFKSEYQRITLANGPWYITQLPQGQHLVFAGAWDLIARRGLVQVEVGGFDPKAVLEEFAASFHF